METIPTTTISARECLTYGWEAFKKRPLVYIAVILIIEVLWLASEYAPVDTTIAGDVAFMLLSLVSAVVYMIVMTYFMLRAHDIPESIEVSDLLRVHNFLKLIGANILSGLVIFLGLLLLIVPGLIAAAALAFCGYLAIDKGLRPVAAFKESARLTKGNRMAIFYIFLTAVVGTAIPSILYFWNETAGHLGTILADIIFLPVTGIGMVHAYRLLENKMAVPEVIETTEPVQTA
jgi:uncharacterized membrane protein